MSDTPVGMEVTFPLDNAPRSLKNRRQIYKAGPRFTSKPSKEAEKDMEMIAERAEEALAGRGMPFDQWDSLRLEYWSNVSDGSFIVRITKIGLIPKIGKKGTRQDLHASLETICDAVQKIVYPDDKTIEEFFGKRVR